MESHVFSYSIDIQGREFRIVVTEDRKIHWDDVVGRRASRGEDDKLLELRTLIGDKKAQRRLRSETENFTIIVDLPTELFERLGEADRSLERGEWTIVDEEKLDPVIEEFFWEHVNQFLNPGLIRSN